MRVFSSTVLLANLLVAQGLMAFVELPSADQDIEKVKRWAWERTTQAVDNFRSQGQYHPSPSDWAGEVVYQIMVDRFNDGDPSNNNLNIEPHQRAHQDNDMSGLADYKHGGDIQGIIDRLDYLQHLGVTALWITPILDGNGAYHGYCTKDFTKIDPSFGNKDLLRELSKQAHARGIKIVLDIVVNHICDSGTRYDDTSTPHQDWAYNMCVEDMNARYWQGSGSVRGQRNLVFGPDFFPPLKNESFYSRCGYRSGDFAGHGPASLFGDFSPSMLDLDTQNWDFQDIFTDLHKYWIAYADIDGFRMDAAKHVTADFVAKFSTDIRAFADSIGKNNFFIVGEVAGIPFEQAVRLGKMRSNWLNPGDLSASIPAALRNRLHTLWSKYTGHLHFGYPGLNAVYDFTHSGIMGEVARQIKAPLQLKTRFYTGAEGDHSQCPEDFCELKANGDPMLNWNVIEIHDWPRFAIFNNRLDQMRTALSYMFTAQGIPVMYYGVEQGLNGICHFQSIHLDGDARGQVEHICRDLDVHNHARYRQDMFASGKWRLGSMLGEVDRYAGIGDSLDLDFDPYTNTEHDHFKFVNQMIEVRKSCRALKRGQTYFRAAHNNRDGGLIAFSRVDGLEEIVVLINSSDHPIPIEKLHVDGAINGGRHFATFKNLLNGYDQGTIGALGSGMGIYFHNIGPGGHRRQFVLGAHKTAIFSLESNTSAYDPHIKAHRCWY